MKSSTKLLMIALTAGEAVLAVSLYNILSQSDFTLGKYLVLIGVIALSGLVCKITRNYLDRQKGLDVKPMLNIFEDKENN